MSANELTLAIANHNQKRLMQASDQMPSRCRYHTDCGNTSTRWAWNKRTQKRVAVCGYCFDYNNDLVAAIAKRNRRQVVAS
jgi:hypothetical protein